MHSGRIPNSNPDEDCNGFKLHNHGQHLLTAQPVYVDGRTQNMHFKHVDRVGAKTAFLTHSDGIRSKAAGTRATASISRKASTKARMKTATDARIGRHSTPAVTTCGASSAASACPP